MENLYGGFPVRIQCVFMGKKVWIQTAVVSMRVFVAVWAPLVDLLGLGRGAREPLIVLIDRVGDSASDPIPLPLVLDI